MPTAPTLIQALQDPKKEALLKKHTQTVMLRGNLSAIQHKLFNALLYTAYPNLPTQDQHEMPARQLMQAIGYNSHDYAHLKAALEGLTTTAVVWGDPRRNEEPWGVSTMMAAAEIVGGVVIWSYSPPMRKRLHHPAWYAVINLAYTRHFRSGYALRLYEIAATFRGVKSTGWHSVEDWKALVGVEDGRYPAYKEFSRCVLRPAVRAVNRLTDLALTLETEKAPGRSHKVIKLRFRITSNPNWPGHPSRDKADPSTAARLPAPADTTQAQPYTPATGLRKKLSEWGISVPNTESLFSLHPRDRIASCVEHIEELSGKKPILNKAGYLIKMLNVAATASPRATPVPAQAQPARTGKATLLGDLITEGSGFSYDPLSPLKKELRSMKVPGYASGTIVAAAVSETLRLHPRHQAVYDTCIQDSTAFPRRFIRVCIPILKKHARDFIPPSQR